MQVEIKQIDGNWDDGYVLHKHTLQSTYLGDDEDGRPKFDTIRSEPGESLFRLKYRSDWSQIKLLANSINSSILPLFPSIGLIIPMPASNQRARQPVDEIAKYVGQIAKIPVFSNIIIKNPAPGGGPQLKDLKTKAEKIAALQGRFAINPAIEGEGRWNALMLDDLFDTGATMEAACAALRTYPKISKIFAAAITWK